MIEIKEYIEEGYSPVIDYDKWRVAILNEIDELYVGNLTKMQKHMESDEVFVLLRGKCTLFVGDGDEEIGNISKYDLEPYKCYNVKKGTWHTHTLTEEGKVLIVENRNTCDDNSPEKELNEDQRSLICHM